MSSKKKTAKKTAPTRLPEALIKQLGDAPVESLAAQFRVKPERIRLEMALRNIKWSIPQMEWDKKKLALLGTASDEKIAEKLGLVKSAISARRWKLGIAPFGKSRAEKSHHWTKKELSWLGKLKDSEIATRIGLSAPSVAWKRRSLDIGQSTIQTKPCRKWTRQQIAMLGKSPDTVVARKLEIHRHQVGLKRQQLGIAPFQLKSKQATGSRRTSATKKKSPTKAQRRNELIWDAKFVARLGRLPDNQLAEELGVTVQAVASRRRALGIQQSSAVQ